MSAWSDWKVGAISDDEYRMACEEEDRRDEWAEEEWMYGQDMGDPEDGRL